jgi:protease-4
MAETAGRFAISSDWTTMNRVHCARRMQPNSIDSIAEISAIANYVRRSLVSAGKGNIEMSQGNMNQIPPQPIVIYQNQPTLFGRLTNWFAWSAFLFCLLLLIGQWAMLGDYFDTTGGIEEKYVSGEKLGDDKIAIISIEGVIMEGDGFVKRQIDRIRNDDNVKAVVIRVDSPGGTVTGSDFIYHHLKKLREEKSLPMVVSMGSMAASGGYYVSMAVGDEPNSIYAEPTTTTGSIGVIIPHYDISGLLAKYDVKDDSIASNERKQMLSMTRPMTPEHRELIQGYIDESFERFKEIVESGRPAFKKDEAALDQLATGEIFSADQALKHGLVDKIGFVEDAVDRAIELAKLDKDKVRVVKFKRPTSLFDLSPMAMSKSSEAFGLSQLLELSSPKAYFLATSLPGFSSYRRAD